MNDLLPLVIITILLPIVGALVFRRISTDYRRLGQLSRTGTMLQVGLFALHGASSYFFLDPRIAALDPRSPLFGLAMVLIICALVLLLSTISKFGVKRAVGQESRGLTCTGMYQRSRNPQLVFYGIVVVGYSLLWPSWTGLSWVLLYAVLGQMMVRTEERHLKRVYDAEYVDYCARTPRYFDFPGMK